MVIRKHRDRDGKVVPSTPWERRLAAMVTMGLPVYSPTCDGELEYTLYRGYDDIPVMVTGHYEPAQRGGWTDPSWDAYYDDIRAYYHRPNKGWVEITLDKDEESAIARWLLERSQDCYDGPDDYDDCRY